MNEHWFRWFHGTTTDPKWKVIAMRACHATSHRVTTRDVIAVWASMLECASQATPRGTLIGWCAEDVAALLEMDVVDVEAIHLAMQGKTLEGNSLKAWERRQVKRERDDVTAADRKRAQRERDAASAGVTPKKDAASHHVTPREEERREEKKEPLSVGKGEPRDSREPDPPPTARADIGATPGAIAKALRSAGIAHVNPSHPALLRLIDAGVTAAEFSDAAAEASAASKGNLAYVCALVEGRRRDAANAGKVTPNAKPMTGSAAHRPYVPERRIARDPNAPEPQALKDILAKLGAADATGDPPRA